MPPTARDIFTADADYVLENEDGNPVNGRDGAQHDSMTVVDCRTTATFWLLEMHARGRHCLLLSWL